MSQIFISYANEDTEFARRLAHVFEHLGWSVWWDKQIPPGMDYAQVIERAVTEASCIVVLWSRHSIGSRWVHTEAAAGADRHVVATVLIDDTPGEQIPFEFRRLQAVNLKDWTPDGAHAGFELLANRIRSILDEPQRPVAVTTTRSSLASWKDAMTSWGRGRQRVYRMGATLAAATGVICGIEAALEHELVFLLCSLALLAVAGWLLHTGRKPD